jgi:hypothetical protein
MKTTVLSRIIFPALIFSSNFLYAQSIDTTYYSVVQGKTIKGIQKRWITNGNEYHYFYEYNDRGRGDSVYDDIVLDKTGWIVKSSSYGTDYFKRPYHASFEIKGDSATSVANDEKKTKRYKHELYSGMQAPGTMELLIKAAIAEPEKKVTFFRGDTMEVKALHEKTVLFHGQALHLFLAEIYYGQNTPPDFVWLENISGMLPAGLPRS